MTTRLTTLHLLVGIVACGCYGSSSDGDTPDGGTVDAGSRDGGSAIDAASSVPDAGTVDSGEPDGGPLVCDRGQTPVTAGCEPCDPGMFCPGNTEPQPCVGSWDHDGDPATECETWITCVPGEFRYGLGSRTEDTDCRPCAPGFDTTEDNAEECEVLPFIDLSIEESRGCGVHSDGTLRCWGWFFGISTPEPRRGTFERVEMGSGGGCGVDSVGGVECWGAPAFDRGLPTGTGFSDVCRSALGACARRESDGSLQCWGGFEHFILPETNATGVACSYMEPCIVYADGSGLCGLTAPPASWGTLADVAARGENVCFLNAEGRAHCSFFTEESPGPDTQFSELFASGEGSWGCGVRVGDGLLECFGNDRPVDAVDERFEVLSLWRSGGCGTTTDGRTVCFGSRSSRGSHGRPDGRRFRTVFARSHRNLGPCGELRGGGWDCVGGLAPDAGFLPPADVSVTGLSVGEDHSCGLLADGTVECWSGGSYTVATPSELRATEVVVGGRESCAVRSSDAMVVCWGTRARPAPLEPLADIQVGLNGVCGIRPADARPVCRDYSSLNLLADAPDEPVRAVSVGLWHACAIHRDDGRTLCWGDPLIVDETPSEMRFQSLATFEDITCGLLPDGTVSCWGLGSYSTGGVPVTQISMGARGLCGIRAFDDSLTCFGEHVPIWNPR